MLHCNQNIRAGLKLITSRAPIMQSTEKYEKGRYFEYVNTVIIQLNQSNLSGSFLIGSHATAYPSINLQGCESENKMARTWTLF